MTYIVGDIHANIRELKKLLDLLRPKREDTLIFLGDYIDKNIYTQETIQLLKSLDKEHKCIFIKGNHEFVWGQYMNHGEPKYQKFLLQYGGIEALSRYSKDAEKLLEDNNFIRIKQLIGPYLQLLEKMEDYYIVDGYLALHAGLLEEQLGQSPLKFSEENYFLRPDRINKNRKYLGKFKVVAGHTYLGEEPTIESGYINIDLGAGCGKYIGTLSVKTNEIIRSDGKIFPIIN